MIKSVEEALQEIFTDGKIVDVVSEKVQEAVDFLYNMEKELNELKHYESVNGQLETFRQLNNK